MPAHPTALVFLSAATLLTGCAAAPVSTPTAPHDGPDTLAIVALARDLSADSMRGRGPWTPENAAAARRLAAELDHLGARPLFGTSLLVPFVTPDHPTDTVYNVIGVLPSRGGATTGELVGVTAHLDHLGIGAPDSSGDRIYNGFLDDAIGCAMVLDVARRYHAAPGDRPLVVMYFNLEEQGLLGSIALAHRADAAQFFGRLRLVVGIDAGSPAGEATTWELMGALPSHPAAQLADSLARRRGWMTRATPPRPISDVNVFAANGIPILFPIPGAEWKGYSAEERGEAMRRFDHYHAPADQFRPDFPLVGTGAFADWVWEIVRATTRS